MPQLQLSLAPLSLTIPAQENKRQSPGQQEQVTTLEESMKQLEIGIQSGTLSFHFEVFKFGLEGNVILYGKENNNPPASVFDATWIYFLPLSCMEVFSV